MKRIEMEDTLSQAMLDELDRWTIDGINVGQAVRKQIIPTALPYVEHEDGVDSTGRTILMTKPYCPDCEEVSYSGRYCQNCGRRLRE